MSDLGPSITIDNSVRYFYPSVDIDPASLIAPYEAIDIEGKPPLKDCRIHFSALAVLEDAQPKLGEFFPNPEEAQLVDVTAPDSDIIVYLGSLSLGEQPAQSVNDALGRQLAHYANKANEEFEPNDETVDMSELFIPKKLPKKSILTAIALFGLSTVNIHAEVDHISIPIDTAAFLGALVIGTILGVKTMLTGSNELIEDSKKWAEAIKEHEKNVQAAEAINIDIGNAVVLGTPKTKGSQPKVPRLIDGMTLQNKVQQGIHRKMSLGKLVGYSI